MLTAILSIGPLARLDRRFLTLLYNRRHFGVLAFLVALAHALFMIEWYIARGALADLAGRAHQLARLRQVHRLSLQGAGARGPADPVPDGRHQPRLLAAALLTPPVWKALHMGVYLAFGLVVLHVAAGRRAVRSSPCGPASWSAPGSCWSRRCICWPDGASAASTAARPPPARAGWSSDRRKSIPDKGARIVTAAGGERIAVFRDGRQIGAVSNLCAHQNGPLGEGRIVDGCITCPWHGYQYRLADGCAPPPFTEKLATYRVRLKRGILEVDPRPLPPGTPAAIECDVAMESN